VESGLGAQKRHNVAVKRAYYKVYPPSTSKASFHYKIGRYTLADEIPKLLKEANVLYWARSLLQLTYDFISKLPNILQCLFVFTEATDSQVPAAADVSHVSTRSNFFNKSLFRLLPTIFCLRLCSSTCCKSFLLLPLI
jgi:hypothetical protein